MVKTTICLVITALGFSVAPFAAAQIAPVCLQVAADAEGDGFGWQDGATCIVTQESEPAPVFTNLETDEFINLTRAYWNPPVDLYNKTVTCIAHRFAQSTGSYVADNDPARETHYSFHYTHLPLTTSAPFTGTVLSEHLVTAGPNNELYHEEFRVSWGMDNGIYTGGAPFTESPYVEIVTEPTTNERVVKTWRSNSEYVQCSAAPSGAPPSIGESPETAVVSTPVENSNNEIDSSSSNNEGGTVDSGLSGNTNDEANIDPVISPVVSNVTAPAAIISNDTVAPEIVPSATVAGSALTSSGGGGSIGFWFVLLLAAFKRSSRC